MNAAARSDRRVVPLREAVRRNAKPRKPAVSAEQRQVEEIDRLIKRLPTFKPLAKFLQAYGVDPRSAEARQACADAFCRAFDDVLKERDADAAE